MAHKNENTTASAETSNDIRALSGEELRTVSGGMKWDHNYVSKNVIDARGGQFTVLGMTFTYDLNGKVTSVS